MRMFHCLLLICVMTTTLFFFGCSTNIPTETATSKTDDRTITEGETENTEVPKEESIEIIGISREVFLDFISNPSSEILRDTTLLKRQYVSSGENYSRGSKLFSVQPSLIEFLKKVNMKTYLEEQGIHTNVKEVLLIDSPRVPMFVWIEADSFCGFVTVEDCWIENNYATHYVYQFYTQEEFYTEYNDILARVTVNAGPCEKFAQAVLYHDYADFPVLEVLELMGATVTQKSENLADVQYNGKEYAFDSNAFSMREKNSGKDAVMPMSGRTFVYKKDGVLMVDSHTLSSLLLELGTPITYAYDRNAKTIEIIVNQL